MWRKAATSYEGGNCVEIGAVEGSIHIRDSKHPGGPRLRLPEDGWRALLVTIRGG